MSFLLSDKQKIDALIYRSQGFSLRRAGELAGVSKTHVQYLTQKFEDHETVKNLWVPRISYMVNEEEVQEIVNAILGNRELTAMDVALDPELNPHGASYSTINRIINRQGLKSKLAKKKFELNTTHKFNRLQFARYHRTWTADDWAEVVFSDESNLFPAKKGRSFVRRYRAETLPSTYTIQTSPWHGGLELLAFGSIHYNGVGELYRVRGTIDSFKFLEILDRHVDWPTIIRNNLIFQHDNCGPFNTDIVNLWFRNLGIMRLSWPSNSPDLNIIENVWSVVKDDLWEERHNIRNKEDLWETALRVWYSERVDRLIPRLYESMPRRIREIIRKDGSYTNY